MVSPSLPFNVNLCTRGEAGELCERWRRHRDERAFNALLHQYGGVVAKLVTYYSGLLPPCAPGHLDKDELLSRGLHGFMEAVETYRPVGANGERHKSFASWLAWRAQGRMRYAVQQPFFESRRLELATASLNRHFAFEEGDECAEPLSFGAGIDDWRRRERLSSLRDDIEVALRGFSPRYRRVLRAWIENGCSQADAARELRTTRQRVNQIVRSAALALQRALAEWAPAGFVVPEAPKPKPKPKPKRPRKTRKPYAAMNKFEKARWRKQARERALKQARGKAARVPEPLPRPARSPQPRPGYILNKTPEIEPT